MPAIPIYNNTPLRPSQPTAVTPQTSSGEADASSATPSRTVPASVPATTTATTPYTPPPPQPGARPTPTTAAAAPPSSDPPPPQPGAAPGYTVSHIETTTTQQQPPPQMFIAPPGHSYLPTKSTAVQDSSQPPPSAMSLNSAPLLYSHQGQPSPAETRAGAADGVRRSLEHPPGYVQNSCGGGAAAGGIQNDSYLGGMGSEENTGGGMWDGVTTWAAGAGEKLADAEKQAWKWALGK